MMGIDIREAIADEASRAPAPELNLASIERRGHRRRLAVRVSFVAGMVGLIVAMASVAAMLGGNAPGADLADPDVAEDPAVATDGSGTRLLDLPFEPGSVIQVGNQIYMSAGSSSAEVQPGQLYLSEDGGDSWELILTGPDQGRLGPFAASADVAVALGLYGTAPEDPPDPLDPDSTAISPWYVVVGQAGVEASHGDDVPRIDDIAGTTGGFVGVYLDPLSDKESECHLVTSSDGVAWVESDLDCPAMSGSLETVGDDIYFTHEFRLWRLAENTWVEGAIDMSRFSDILDSTNSHLGFNRGAVDGNGLTSFTGRVVFHASKDDPEIIRTDAFIASSVDGGPWTVDRVAVDGDTFPYGITGVDSGFISVVAGEVLFSPDGVEWEATGEYLGDDYWSWEPGVVADGKVLMIVGPPEGKWLPRRLAVIELN